MADDDETVAEWLLGGLDRPAEVPDGLLVQQEPDEDYWLARVAGATEGRLVLSGTDGAVGSFDLGREQLFVARAGQSVALAVRGRHGLLTAAPSLATGGVHGQAAALGARQLMDLLVSGN